MNFVNESHSNIKAKDDEFPLLGVKDKRYYKYRRPIIYPNGKIIGHNSPYLSQNYKEIQKTKARGQSKGSGDEFLLSMTLKPKALLNLGKPLTIMVGFIILGFAWIAYILNFKDLSLISYSEKIIYAGWFLSGVFIVSSIGDFKMVGLFKKIKSTKFAEFDTKYFIPLTSFWAITFALLAYQV